MHRITSAFMCSEVLLNLFSSFTSVCACACVHVRVCAEFSIFSVFDHVICIQGQSDLVLFELDFFLLLFCFFFLFHLIVLNKIYNAVFRAKH